MARFRVCLKTVVNVMVDVEAEDSRAALDAADSQLDLDETFRGRAGVRGQAELAWGEEHAYALVDRLDESGAMLWEDAAEFGGPYFQFRSKPLAEDWEVLRAPESTAGEAT